MSICAGVVIAISFQKVDDTPNCEARTERDYESLENTYCTVEKLHDFFAGIIFAQVKSRVKSKSRNENRMCGFSIPASPFNYSFLLRSDFAARSCLVSIFNGTIKRSGKALFGGRSDGADKHPSI